MTFLLHDKHACLWRCIEIARFLRNVIGMTEIEKQQLSKIIGDTFIMLEESYSIEQIAKELKVEPWQVEYNIDDILYRLRRRLGWRRYIRTMFIK